MECEQERIAGSHHPCTQLVYHEGSLDKELLIRCTNDSCHDFRVYSRRVLLQLTYLFLLHQTPSVRTGRS
jgi:hypothetical protein